MISVFTFLGAGTLKGPLSPGQLSPKQFVIERLSCNNFFFFNKFEFCSGNLLSSLYLGRGLFTTQTFGQGDFLLVYRGSRISEDEGLKRLNSSKHSKKAGSYIYFIQDIGNKFFWLVETCLE